MAPPIPSGEPTSARAGDTWLWSTSFGDYPVGEGWALSYELRGTNVPDTITLAASLCVANSTGWDVAVPATTTSAYTAGTYQFVAVLTGSGTYAGRVYQVALNPLSILPNLVIAGPGDLKSWAQSRLEDVEKWIEQILAGKEPQGYTIDGEQVQLPSLKELQAERIRLTNEVNQASNPQGFGRRVDTAFVTTGSRAGSMWTETGTRSMWE